MFDAILRSWQFDFWFGLICLAAGIAAVSPFLLSWRFRRWFSDKDFNLEAIGLVALILCIIGIGLYNRFGAASGA